MLLQKVEHPQLRDAVGALRVRAQLNGITFTERASHLSAIVLELPDHQVRKIAAAESKVRPKHLRGGGGANGTLGAKRKGIYMPDDIVYTGNVSDWDKMSDTSKQIVTDTRKKNKAKGLTPNKKKVGNLKAQQAEFKRSIAAMQSKTSHDDTNDKSDYSDAPDNAGDVFGSRQKKNQKKE